jgi:hypothetical protein
VHPGGARGAGRCAPRGVGRSVRLLRHLAAPCIIGYGQGQGQGARGKGQGAPAAGSVAGTALAAPRSAARPIPATLPAAGRPPSLPPPGPMPLPAPRSIALAPCPLRRHAWRPAASRGAHLRCLKVGQHHQPRGHLVQVPLLHGLDQHVQRHRRRLVVVLPALAPGHRVGGQQVAGVRAHERLRHGDVRVQVGGARGALALALGHHLVVHGIAGACGPAGWAGSGAWGRWRGGGRRAGLVPWSRDVQAEAGRQAGGRAPVVPNITSATSCMGLLSICGGGGGGRYACAAGRERQRAAPPVSMLRTLASRKVKRARPACSRCGCMEGPTSKRNTISSLPLTAMLLRLGSRMRPRPLCCSSAPRPASDA